VTKEDGVLREAAILKAAAGVRLDVYVPDSFKIPQQLPSTVPARFSQATLQRRATEEATRVAERKLVDEFLALNERAVSLGLSDAKLNDLAVVKELLIANSTRALEEARDILGKYNASLSKDDDAQRAALEAFARFGYASRPTRTRESDTTHVDTTAVSSSRWCLSPLVSSLRAIPLPALFALPPDCSLKTPSNSC